MLGGVAVADGIEILKDFPGDVALPQGGKSHGDPHGGVGVLSAVLAHARNVALDVAGVPRRDIEGRIEKPHETMVAVHQPVKDRLHRGAGALRIGAAGQHRPALGNGIDPAFGAFDGAQGRAVVEEAAQIPLPVPGMLIEVGRQGPGLVCAGGGKGGIAAPRGQRSKSRRTRSRKKPSQTLSPRPWWPTRFMPSFQSPEPMSGKPWRPQRRACRMARWPCS